MTPPGFRRADDVSPGPASDCERRKGAHGNVNEMQGMVPMWDTRVARAYNRDELQDVEAGRVPPTGRGAPGGRGSAAESQGFLGRGLYRFVRTALFNLRRVKPVPDSA